MSGAQEQIGSPPDAGASAPNADSSFDGLTVRPRTRRWEWIGVAVLVVLVIIIGGSVVRNDRFGWGVIGDYLFDSQILAGLRSTVILTIIAMALALAIGLLLALMRLSSNVALKSASWGYVWIFRGTPVLVQVLFWFNLAALYPQVSIGVPFGGPNLVEGNVNDLLTPWVAAILGLALSEAAYLAEIIRSGIISVEPGQTEAARALGMRRTLRFRRVVLPQALRIMVPPMGNETIGLLKSTSIVSVIAVSELLYSGQLIYANNYQVIPLLMVVSIWYIVAVTILTMIQALIERRLAVGWTGAGGSHDSMWDDLLSFGRRRGK